MPPRTVWKARLGARLTVAALVAALAPLCAGTAAAQAQASVTAANRDAYNHVLVCYTANSIAADLRRERGDTATAQRYERQASRCLEYASMLGGRLGFSSTRVEADAGRVAEREIPKLMADPAYVTQTTATCRRLGLM